MNDSDRIKELEAEVAKWKSTYTCCKSSPDCANNKLKKLVDDLLGDGEWNYKKERLYCVIESIYTKGDMAEIHRQELIAENLRLHSVGNKLKHENLRLLEELGRCKEALEYFVNWFEKFKEKQRKLLIEGQTLQSACDNWDEASSMDDDPLNFDIAKDCLTSLSKGMNR